MSMIYYVLNDDDCRFEGMTKEQTIAAIAEATGNTPTGVDAAFITKIKEQNANASMKVWVGTRAQYNALATKDAETLYFIPAEMNKDFVVTQTASLTVAGWIASGNTYTQTANVTGITESKNIVVTPSPDSFNAYGAAGVYCSSQGSGTITFTASKVPDIALTVNVLILGG